MKIVVGKMKRKTIILSALMILGFVFVSQFTNVTAAWTRYNDIGYLNDGYIYIYCKVSIWAQDKPYGGVHMNHQYYELEVISNEDCGVQWVTVLFIIQDETAYSETVIDNSPGYDWGPDDVYDDNDDYYEYHFSNMVVWAYIIVSVYYLKLGDTFPTLRYASAEASYEPDNP
jgi:hypothetical protein